ncbi:hypothetical protein [Flavobacterium litorale]|uniref:Outer membrane protein beta-barrel domain-containing protein n=1 Tax=Flavobacterium litorale TaxID=2856519 RepID=A0ABX8V6L3_9FLAO|nr:hypothetical protein [Flavobacterium litorale]QYJ68397.1 hypothetical protein K1I41_00480 [Flavobacterium litorale]
MKNILFIVVLLLMSYSAVFSQTNIELKTVPFEIQHQNFYIESVFDDRPVQHLGIVKDISGNESKFQLKDGASVAIKKFMDVALDKSDERIPITIRIKALEIKQVQTSIDEITARIYIRLAFFSEEGLTEGELFNISHNEDQNFSLSNSTEIVETHEKRIRAALEYCMQSFVNNPNVVTKGIISKKNENSTLHFSKSRSLLQTNVPLNRWFNLLIFKKTSDKHHNGWEVGYTGFTDSDSNFIIPFEISYGQSRAKTDRVRERGYSSIDTYAFGSGFSGLIKIIPRVYVDIGLNIPIGMEVLRDLEHKKSHNFLIGVGASQGVKIIPWKEFGIVIGAGISQQLQTSKVYKRNFGFELELGINF